MRLEATAHAGRCLCLGGAVVWPLLQWSLPDAGLFPEGASVHFGRAQVVALPPCPGPRDLLGAHCLLKGGAPLLCG